MRRHSLRVLDLAVVVAGVGLLQLVIGRLIVPHWQPAPGKTPADWHAQLAWVSSFMRHFMGVLAPAVMVAQAVHILLRGDILARPIAIVVTSLTSLAAVALMLATFGALPDRAGVAVELVAAVATLGIAVALMSTRADVIARVAVLFAVLPIALHVTAALGALNATDLLPGFKPWHERVLESAQWSIAVLGLAAPFLFGPRPLSTAVLHPIPMVATVLISGAAPILVRRRFDLASEIAGRGFGVQLHEPSGADVMWLLALLGMVWTMTSCLVSKQPGRRAVAVGLALWTVAGYSFQWPYLIATSTLGFLILLEAVPEASSDEGAAVAAARLGRASAGPPVDAGAWRGYAEALTTQLGSGSVGLTDSRCEIHLADGVEITHVTGKRTGMAVSLTLSRDSAGIQSIVLTCGDDVPVESPAWTLAVRSRGLSGAAAQPPLSSGKPVKTGDAIFDSRFVVHDADGASARLLDDGLRARATAILDGWIALWPKRSLRWVITPGKQGVPANQPIALASLTAPDAAEPLLRLVDLVTTIATRAQLPATTE